MLRSGTYVGSAVQPQLTDRALVRFPRQERNGGFHYRTPPASVDVWAKRCQVASNSWPPANMFTAVAPLTEPIPLLPSPPLSLPPPTLPSIVLLTQIRPPPCGHLSLPCMSWPGQPC